MRSVSLSSPKRASNYIYFIRAMGTPYVKVGISNNVERRLATLQTGNHEELRLVTVIGPYDKPGTARVLEARIHVALCFEHVRGEWYRVPRDEDIEDVLESAGFSVRH